MLSMLLLAKVFWTHTPCLLFYIIMGLITCTDFSRILKLSKKCDDAYDQTSMCLDLLLQTILRQGQNSSTIFAHALKKIGQT